uniref:Guanylate cyclase domain-containing protein n=1 Tax=Strongyloides stercoralis TaxID=6248 RepID=A0A0K0DWB8_STRER
MPASIFLLILISTSLFFKTFPQEINNRNNTGLVLASPISKAKKELEEIASRPDLLCNIDSDYECICHQSLGDLEGKYIPCNEFIQVENLPTIQLKLKNANLSARLHTNEPFEEYFKRRISDILTRYCQNNANECIGVQQRLTKDQVIILAVNYLPNRITLVDLVVAKKPNIGSLNGLMLMDPVQVKFILSAQSTPLSRVLGGIKIEEVKTNNLSRITPPLILQNDDDEPLLLPVYVAPTQSMNIHDNETLKQNAGGNSTLKILLAIVGIFLLICYIIATYKVCRDHYLKKKARARAEASLVPTRSNSIRNYGTLPSQKSHQTDNSSTNKTSISHYNKTNVFGDSNNNKNLQYSTASPTTAGWSNGEEEGNITPAITPHSFKRMFMCDVSQLPREPTIDLESQIIEEDSEEIRKIEHPMEFGIPITHQEEEDIKSQIEKSYPLSDLTPDLIVDSESLQDYELSNISINNNHEQNMLMTTVQSERPISRRGSVTSPTSDPQDLETTYSREETPAPIMEEELIPKPPIIMEEDEPPVVGENDAKINNKKPKMIPVVSITTDDDLVIEDEFDERNDVFNKIVNAKNETADETWTSDEDDDRNNINLYKIMSEEHVEESEKSDEEEDIDETNTYYQRLQESPTVPFEIPSPNKTNKDKHIGNNHIPKYGIIEDDENDDLR